MFKKRSETTAVRLKAAARWLLLAATMILLAPAAHAEQDYLEPELAFKFTAKMADAKTVLVTYAIADGYYMYRERFRIQAEGATIGAPIYPKGKVKFDETFQRDVETYRHTITITVPVEATGPFTLSVTGQGCADKGLCYPPMESQAKLGAGGGLLAAVAAARERFGSGRSRPDNADAPAASAANPSQAATDQESGAIERALKSGKLLAVMPLFLLLGLGLSFTPCVLPMVPILSFIIVGEGAQVSRRRGFVLSATYSFGMALVYTALGVAAGLAGEGLAATLQNPWVLSGFALLLTALSLSMFGVYQLQIPAAIQMKLMQVSERQAAGKLLGVLVMGAMSALIVGPCVAAPLAGALVYISQTRDVIVGGSALFAMAAGMSVPLLLVGVSAGTLLPRAGAWMESVTRFFGVLMLALALWMVTPIIPAVAQMLGWAALGVGYGGYLLKSKRSGWVPKVAGLLFAAFGIVQLVGATTGGRDALAPLAHLTAGSSQMRAFTRINTVADLDAALASAGGKTALLDFYADWCVSCKEMEKLTFTDPRIQAQFADMLLLQVDVTANNSDDKALLKRFQLFGPPGIIFFDKHGGEIGRGRVIGYQDAERFLQSLARVRQF